MSLAFQHHPVDPPLVGNFARSLGLDAQEKITAEWGKAALGLHQNVRCGDHHHLGGLTGGAADSVGHHDVVAEPVRIKLAFRPIFFGVG